MNYYGPNVPLPYEVNHPHDVDGVPQGNVLWEFCPLETDIDRRGQQPGERTPYRAPDTLTVVSTNMQDGLAPVRVEAQNGPIQNEPDRTAAVQAYAGRLVKIGADIIHFTEASPEKKRTADGEALENGPKDEPEIDQRLLDPETGIFKDYYAVVMDEADGDDRRDRHTAVVLVRRGLRVELAALRAGARNVLRLSTFIGTTAITMYLDHAPDRPAATRADHIAAIAADIASIKAAAAEAHDITPRAFLAMGDLNTVRHDTWQGRILGSTPAKVVADALPASEPGEMPSRSALPGKFGRAHDLLRRGIPRVGSLLQRLTRMAETATGGPLHTLRAAGLELVDRRNQVTKAVTKKIPFIGTQLDHAVQEGLEIVPENGRNLRFYPTGDASDHEGIGLTVRAAQERPNKPSPEHILWAAQELLSHFGVDVDPNEEPDEFLAALKQIDPRYRGDRTLIRLQLEADDTKWDEESLAVIMRAAEYVGLLGRETPLTGNWDMVIALGGARQANLDRPQHAIRALRQGLARFKRLVIGGASTRMLTDEKEKQNVQNYAPNAQNEYDLCAAAATFVGAWNPDVNVQAVDVAVPKADTEKVLRAIFEQEQDKRAQNPGLPALHRVAAITTELYRAFTALDLDRVAHDFGIMETYAAGNPSDARVAANRKPATYLSEILRTLRAAVVAVQAEKRRRQNENLAA